MGENNGCLNLFHGLNRGEKQLGSKDWKFCKWRLAKSPLKMVKCTLFLGDARLCGQTEAGFPSVGEWTGATQTGVRGSAPITCRCFSYIICSQQRCPLICGTAVEGLGVQRYPCLQCLVLSPVFLSTGWVLGCLRTPSRYGPHLGGTPSLIIGTYAGLPHPSCMFIAGNLAQFLLVRNNSFIRLFPICNKG